MRIRTFTRLVGLSAIGAVAYVHRQRGGEWTISSLQDTLRHIGSSLRTMCEPTEQRTRETLQRGANVGSSRGTSTSDDNARSFTDYKGRKDDMSRH